MAKTRPGNREPDALNGVSRPSASVRSRPNFTWLGVRDSPFASAGETPRSPWIRFERSAKSRLGEKLATLSDKDAGALRRLMTEMYGE